MQNQKWVFPKYSFTLQQVSTDGERNNERQESQRRRRLQNTAMNRSATEVRGVARERQVGRNNNMDYAGRSSRDSGVGGFIYYSGCIGMR